MSTRITRPGPGHRFADRELLNITRLALSRIYTAPSHEASPDMQEAARQALAELEGRDSLGPPAAVTDALAKTDRAQTTARSQIPGGALGDFALPAELAALRELAEAVRAMIRKET